MDVLQDREAEKALARYRRIALARAKRKALRLACECFPRPDAYVAGLATWNEVHEARHAFVNARYRNFARRSGHRDGNPRRYWKGDDALTIQERQAALREKDTW